MKTRHIILGFVAIVILGFIAVSVFPLFPQNPEKTQEIPGSTKTQISNFEECVGAGNAVMESFPRKCSDGGKVFVEDIGNTLEKSDLIRLDSPRPNEAITSPLTIRGTARGYWFFEASFPIRLVDEKGEVLGEALATAQGEWMTEEFVPFEAVLKFDNNKTPGSKGTLVLKKDNPSGLPENEDAMKVPVLIGDMESESGTIKKPSYENTMEFVNGNITEIIKSYSSKKPTNGQWFADGFGFTSLNHVYVDFEDGHYLFRALLNCTSIENKITCTPLAVFEKQKQGWLVVEGTDTQKEYPIIYKWAKDYTWER